jgi:hypothetical protein
MKKRKRTVQKGKPNNVKRRLIEKIVGKGRWGNVYKWFPTIKRSKYVPSNEENNKTGT